MARGYSSLHPLTEEALRNLGVRSGDVTQGHGSAAASAGYHQAVGTYRGRKYGPCLDLVAELISSEFMARMWGAGFVAFARIRGWQWRGSSHIHAIHLGLRDDGGQVHLPSGPRSQIVDFLHDPPLSGLVGHAQLQGLKPTHELQAELRRQYAQWVPDYPTTVYSPEGAPIRCYAWLQDGTVWVDTGAFCRWWGVTTVHPEGEVSDGRFWRAPIRPLAGALGLYVKAFQWNGSHTSAAVRLAYAKGGA